MDSEIVANASSALQEVVQNSTVPVVSSLPPIAEPSNVGVAAGIILAIFTTLPSLLLWFIAFLTITLPTWLFTFLSTSLTLTVNMTTVVLILVFFVSTASWVVRYRFLNMYSRLPPEPQRKEPQVEVFPDTQETDSKQGLANYLDEFLSAIKVFGYLERPVFHELTRTMQTRKLIAGETILLEEEKGFCLVVDGLVQIFVKSNKEREEDPSTGRTTPEETGVDDEGRVRGNQGYQLLTEVKNGAPMSSLFSILSLFTEDVKLRHDEKGDSASGAPDSAQPQTPHSNRPSGAATPLSPIFSPELTATGGESHTTLQGLDAASFAQSAVPSFSLNDPNDPGVEPRSRQGSTQSTRRQSVKQISAHPDIVARASVDTTIAIIPATAFRRLTRVYPKATSHIVQVILTRLQRVTMATGHQYLGLTGEVLRTERLMDGYTAYDLPDFLKGDAMTRLKSKFTKEKERTGPEEISKGIALHNPRAGQRKKTATGLRKEAVLHARAAPSSRRGHGGRSESIHTPTRSSRLGQERGLLTDDEKDRSGVSAGDLLTNNNNAARQGGRKNLAPYSLPFQTPRPLGRDAMSPMASRNFNPFDAHIKTLRRQDSVDEDMIFRESILDCMFKAIGLTNMKDGLSRTDSLPQSPKLVSYDSRRQKAVFNNAFGFIDQFDPNDGETESVVSNSGLSATGNMNILEDMKEEVEIVFFPKGSVLVEQGERNPGLYYVIDGFLDVSVPIEESEAAESNIFGTSHDADLADEPQTIRSSAGRNMGSVRRPSSLNLNQNPPSKARKPKHKSLFLTKPGGLAGYLGTVSAYRSFIDVTAKTDVYVGFLPRAAVEKIVDRFPIVLLTIAKRLTTLLPKLILHIDFALEWVQVNAGQVIYNQKEESDAIYIVLNGRLRAIQEGADDKMRVIGEYGQGDSVGELEVLTESTRPGTLLAIRDTELAKFPKSLFNSLAHEHPGITMKISKIIASRMRALIEDPTSEHGKDTSRIATRTKASSTTNLRTVAILPVTAGVPVVEFGHRLLSALNQIGATPQRTTSLNQAAILNHLGRHAFTKMGKLKLSQYLADLEEKFALVLYVADTNVKSPWTQTCINQADCILLVGLAEGSPAIGEYERFLLTTKTTARKELVLLHAERYCHPGLTRKWLRDRSWINGSHHHIQMSFRDPTEPVHPQIRRFSTVIKQRVQVIQAEIQKYTSRKVRQTPLYSAETPFKGDFHRLARRLLGKSVGLVLGGGGARGIAHVGIIKALEEAGIPIDIVGGTSIGSFIGALYAWDADVVPMYGRAKKFSGRMGSMWRFALDLTYPSASYTTGHEFNRGIFKTFGDSQIEDFWLEYYCNTTNISKSRSEIHTSGYAWRYVRASMSLAGLLPPLCDEGNMLLDGGYVDNLTVAHMKSLGADVIFAVDVGALDDDNPQAYGDSLSGFWASFNRWNPFSAYPNPPTLSEIQARLAYVSSIDALERAKTTPGCLYMRPPIDAYGTLEFAKFDEIYQVGYKYGQEFLAKLREDGVLPVMEETEERKNLRRTMAPRRASI
ncbi:patatin-like serine hydrolase [Aureobasidium pullulans]|nr:patatin-like serine hydrolase [Aureobasidium pullulans]